MLVRMSSQQLAIWSLAKSHFINTLGISGPTAMFSKVGDDLSIALTYAEDGHAFVVRETIPHCAGPAYVARVCGSLTGCLAVSYAKAFDRMPPWVA